ncbi:MAG: MFS transporter [Blautia sp.]|nr:MFS transporter [Blautia sp.]
MKQTKQLKAINYIAILSIFLFSGAGSFMNAAVQTMMDAWPQLSPTTVRLVTSLPSLVSLPVTIWIGTVAGKQLSFRFCSIFGTALILLGGIAPFLFSSNWTLVLVFRGVVGVGVGFIAMRNSLILRTVPEEKQAAIIGYGSSLLNAGGMLAGPIVGILAGIGWKYSFLYDLLAVIPLLIMIFYLKEPEKLPETAQPQNAQSKEKRPDTKNYSGEKKSDIRMIIYIVMQFIGTAALYPLLSGMSSYMSSNQIGSSFLAGLAVSTYNLAGVLINMILAPLMKKLGRHSLWICHLVFAGGMALIFFMPHVPTVFAGAAICGLSFNMLISVFQLYNGKVASPAQATLGSTLLIAALSLGNFASVYYINICHSLFHMSSDIRSTYFGSMLLYIVLGAICILTKIAPKEEYRR